MPETTARYTRMARSPRFQALLAAKRRFILPITVFFFVFYFSLPVMTSYSHVLNRPLIGAITGAWVFAFVQFVMIWTLCGLYVKKAAQFDALAAEALKAEGGEDA